MKKLIALLLALVMVFGMVACGNEKAPEAAPEKAPEAAPEKTPEAVPEAETKEPGIVKVLTTPFSTETDAADLAIFAQMEEALNIKFEFEIVTDIEQVVSTQIAAGGVTADIFRCGSISGEVLAASGTVVTLSDYFDTTLADAAAVLESNDYLKRAVTCADGNVYWLPKYYTAPISSIPMIRQDWLDKLNLETPTTIEELHDVLVAFRDGDPNGNGEADEIPYDTMQLSYTWLYTAPWFGIEPVACWYQMALDDNGNVESWLTTEEGKALITTLNQWYEEGLLFNDLANENTDIYTEHLLADRIGFNTYGNYSMGYDAAVEAATPGSGAKYVFLEPPTTGYGTTGVRMGGISSTLHYISSKGENIEDALRVFNYCFSEAGGRANTCGVEGEHYVINDDGTLALGPAYEGKTFEEMATLRNVEVGYNMHASFPIYVTSTVNNFQGLFSEFGSKDAEAYDKLLSDDKFTHQGEVQFRFTPEEVETLTELQGLSKSYIEGELAKFICGTRDMAEWDAFVETLYNEYSLAEQVELYATCYARSQG